MNTQPVIDIKDLSFSYDRQKVLRSVNLRIYPGDFAGIIGPNGGGKSTLLRLIMGIIQPDTGSVSVLGMPPEKARSRVGYLAQHAHHDPGFPVTVMEVVLMGCLGRGWLPGPFRKSEKERAMAALKRVGMADIAGKSMSALSGGQRQRVLIARALVCEPELLLLDEPMSHIDISAEKELLQLLEKLSADHTILIVSHDIGFVTKKIKKVVCVNRQVVLHPTSEINGEVISSLYGTDMRLVRHDHECSEKGHKWPGS